MGRSVAEGSRTICPTMGLRLVASALAIACLFASAMVVFNAAPDTSGAFPGAPYQERSS